MHMPIKREAKDLSFFVGIGSGLNPISMLVPMATTGLTVSVGFSRSGFWENAGPIAIGLPFFCAQIICTPFLLLFMPLSLA
jgi:hypothetical protein